MAILPYITFFQLREEQETPTLLTRPRQWGGIIIRHFLRTSLHTKKSKGKRPRKIVEGKQQPSALWTHPHAYVTVRPLFPWLLRV